MDLATLNGDVCAEGTPDGLGERFGTVHDEEVTALRIKAALNQVIEQGLHGSGVLCGPLNDAQRVLFPQNVNADGSDHQ